MVLGLMMVCTRFGAAARVRNDERALAALTLSIATVHVWNRLNAATRQVAGSAW